MRVAVDCRMLRMSGIGRYIRSLVSALARVGPDLELTLAGEVGDVEAWLASEVELKARVGRVLSFTAPMYSLREQVEGSLLRWRTGEGPAVVHFPHYNAPWALPRPSVITIHDLIHFHFPEAHSRWKLGAARMVLANAVRKAARIIAISRHTAEDLAQMFPDCVGRIRLTYPGVAPFFSSSSSAAVAAFKQERGLGRYLLYVGNRKPHKNVGRLLHAYHLLLREFPDLQLVVAGKRFATEDDVTRLTRELGLNGVVEWEPPSDDQLRLLYCGAEAVTLPSLYEGFGLPPLEAMACGVPVVVARAASLPEVVGEAGVYVEPRDVEDIARGLREVLVDETLRAKLREAGLVRARQFSWERTARETVEVYRESLEEA